MIHLTKADAQWLAKLLDIVEYIYQEYPELFNKEDEETLAIARELIRSIQ
jgi:hypothetical protein